MTALSIIIATYSRADLLWGLSGCAQRLRRAAVEGTMIDVQERAQSPFSSEAATKVAPVSVVIATLERPDALARCLDALLRASQPPAEIIVVDQSRDDRSTNLVREWYSGAFALQAGQSPVVRHIRQRRRGLAAARNAGIAAARYPIIAVTDDDCVPDEGWVAAAYRVLTDVRAPAAVTGPVRPLGPEAPDRYPVSSRTGNVRAEFSGRTVPWFVGTGANFAIQRAWLERIGSYDERLGAGSPGQAAEEMDLFYRLLRAGARIRYEPDAVVYHERQTRERRIATRYSYSYGIGAFCGLWLRRGDLYAVAMLGQWLHRQASRLLTAARAGDRTGVYWRWLSLRGTASGLLYGLRAGGGGPDG
jgi:GT2 family glycosyltransferase